MATGDPRKRTKNPMFVQYANGWEHLQAKTPENLRWAWDVSMTAFGALHGLGGNMWNQEEAWEWLREHHREFRAFLDGIIGSQDAPARITPEMMRTLTEHCAHVRLESKWDGWPAKVREQLPQRWAKRRPAVEAVVYARLLATTPPEHHADLSLPTTTPPEYKPSPRYVETSTPQDPLDGLYLNLREFLRRGELDRLHRCPVCQRYFVQATRRAQQYCDTPCRLKANLTRKEQNATYQQGHREKLIREDLRKIRQVKDQLWQTGVRELTLSWVLEEAGVSQRRWTTLRRWEIEQYGKPQATDLTTRTGPLARSG